jgi:hypothetical protein
VWFLDTIMTVKAGGLDTHDAFTLIEFAASSGFGPPLHINHREDETFYVLEGSAGAGWIRRHRLWLVRRRLGLRRGCCLCLLRVREAVREARLDTRIFLP